jgi:hypothetical protein
MGPANPWSPNWRPDPTGRRLASIRAARRGALIGGVLLTIVTIVAVATAPEAEGRPPILAAIAGATALPGLALLGAGLAPATLGSRIDAVVAGLAMALGAPVAAVTSIAIAVVILALVDGHGLAGDALGTVVRAGVIAGTRVAPLLAVAVAVWVIGVRRFGRSTVTPEA